jgi:hypothetical protein
MPGIVVAVGGFATDRLRAAVQKLVYLPSHHSEAVALSAELAIGWAGPRERIERQTWTGEPGHEVHVWRYGHTFKDAGQPQPISAAQILRDYMSEGIEACYAYEGAFVIVVADLRLQRLYVVPDRLCTQPLYYTRAGDDIVIGPEVKALCTVIARAPTLSRDGLIGFLSIGYDIAARTAFNDIQRVEMGKMLEITLDRPKRCTARRFWKMDFSSRQKLTDRRDAEDVLIQSIKHAHRVLLSDQPAFQILLSGGADSRGMLATCCMLGVLPAKAISWGLLQDAPRSDAAIAKSLAERCGVPLDFIATRTDTFVENCEQWAYVSELSNDNFGWYGEGFGTLRYLDQAGYPCSLIGDEAWGWQGFAYDELHAYSKVLAPSVPASLLALMPEHRREAAASSYLANVRDAMRDCHDTDWTDRKDFFYMHARVARFILALGYHRGQALEQRRPFLTRGVLDVVQRLPAEFRVYKNLYLTMLQRYLPKAARVPYPSVNSLPDWNFDLRANAGLRACFLQILHDPLIESGSLGDVLDLGRFRALRDAFFAQRPAPVSRRSRASRIIKDHAKELLRRQPIYKHVDGWIHSRSRERPAPTIAPLDILRRVAILVLLERQLHRFPNA